MIKFKHLFSFIFVFCTASAFVQAQNATSHYEFSFGEFHELKVVDGINVDYQCDPSKAGKVEFEAPADLASAIIFEPSKGKLSIQLALRDGSYLNLPTVKVYSTYLNKVSNEGDSLVRVLSVAKGPQFSCRVMGNGRLSVRDVDATTVDASILSGHGIISITGRADKIKLKITGAGSIQADELSAKEGDCSVTGTGVINCSVSELMKAGGVGSGKIIYRGEPEIKKGFLTRVKLEQAAY